MFMFIIICQFILNKNSPSKIEPELHMYTEALSQSSLDRHPRHTHVRATIKKRYTNRRSNCKAFKI